MNGFDGYENSMTPDKKSLKNAKGQGKAPVKKASVKKSPVKKATVKKTAVKKASVKKSPVKKAAAAAAKTGVKYQKPAAKKKPVKKRSGSGQTVPPKTTGAGSQKSLFKRLFYYGAVAGIWSVIAMIILLAYLARGIPDLDNPPAAGSDTPTVIVKARNGYTLARTGPVYGDWIPYDALPPMMIKALTATEDKNFFTHTGIDGMGLMRALYVNLTAGRVRAGGSTITQQLAKNLFLTEQRTLTRKAQELLLTFWLEQKFTKQQILTLYLNRVYFGGGTYGLDAAARKYFGHSGRVLSVQEAAMLTGLLKAPSRYAPHINPAGAWTRAQVVLSRMAAEGVLTPAAKDSLVRQAPATISARTGLEARYFTDWVTQEARKLMDIQGQSVIIHTTLDPGSQQAAAQSLKRALEKEGKKSKASQGALVSLDHDGAVRAMVGGRNYGKSQYNRAVQARRQPGSAFKLFVYLAALESGIDPLDVFEDAPINIDGYQPTNYSNKYFGPLTVKQAFFGSTNTVAVKIAEKTGRLKVVEMAKRLGVTTAIEPHASLPLGTEEVRMIDLAAAYASVANGGHGARPYTILEMNTLDGEIIYRHQVRPARPVLSYPVVEKITDMMTAVVDIGTGKNARIDRPAAGKTGTSQDSRDAVFAGFTSDMTTVVWVGNDDNSPMHYVTGGGLPARIWQDYNIQAHAGNPVRPLLTDAGYFQGQAKPAPKKKKKSFLKRLFN